MLRLVRVNAGDDQRVHHNTVSQTIEVNRHRTTDENVELATAVITDQRIASLKEQIKTRAFGAMDAHLERLGVGWNVRQELLETLRPRHCDGACSPPRGSRSSKLPSRSLNAAPQELSALLGVMRNGHPRPVVGSPGLARM